MAKHYLFVVPSLTTGGAERVVSVLANGLVAAGQKVTVLIYFDTQTKYELDNRVDLINFSGGDECVYNNMNYYCRLTKLHRYIYDANPDFIIPFLYHVCIQVLVAAFGFRKRIIQTIRNNPRLFPDSLLQRWLRNSFLLASPKIMVQNNEQKNMFPSFLKRKMFVLPNPVSNDFLKSTRTEPNNFLIVAVGRLTEQKNFTLVIKAVKCIVNVYPNIRLNIYGDGPLRSSLDDLVKQLNLEANVFLMGRSENVKKILENASLFVLSSNFEGMPNALLEAMAIGVPCISTKCSTGPMELIENGKDGLLVDVDNIEEMVNAFKFMIENPKHMHLIGKNAKSKILQFYTEEKIVFDFITCLNSI